jgi:large subunit ribosomal protein L4
MSMSAAKTRHMVDFMKRFEFSDMLLVTAETDTTIVRCASNLSNVTVLPSSGVNVYDVLLRSNLVMTRAAVEALTARLEAGC